jgi:hypothetical protein
MAIGGYAAARALGLRVPQEVALVGYDDIGPSALLQPPLTTVRTAYHDFGRLAAQLLIDLIEGRLVPPQRVVITPELIVRGSTGPAPAGVRPLSRPAAALAPAGDLTAKRLLVSGPVEPAELLAAAVAAAGAELVSPHGDVAERTPVDVAMHVVDLRPHLGAGLVAARAEAEEISRALGRGGAFVLVALLPARDEILAAAAAAGVERVVRTLTTGWSGRGLRVNAILASAADVPGAAGACQFLASDAASALNGQVLRTAQPEQD